RCKETLDTIRTLNNNISIHDQNGKMVATALGQLEQKEDFIEKKYEQLLTGSLHPDKLELFADKMPGQKQGILDIKEKLVRQPQRDSVGRDILIKRKREFIQTLDNAFKIFEDDLRYIDEVKNDLANARSQIDSKREQDINARFVMESSYESLLKELRQLEEELERSVQEEEVLIGEYRDLLEPVNPHIEIKHSTDQLLFTLLAASESEDNLWSSPGQTIESNKVRPMKRSPAKTRATGL
ncbi:MAG: hypothetical protein ACE5GQ_05875, partial [Nitrospinales bacterium]